MNLSELLKEYIDEEYDAAILYEELSKIAPNANYKQLLQAMSKDEHDHALSFQAIYHAMMNEEYAPTLSKPELQSSFDDILWMRLLEETSTFRRYSYHQIDALANKELEKALYIAKTDETVHAFRILYMIMK